MGLIESQPSQATMFADYYILKRSDNKWGKPSHLYIDSPYLETALTAYFDALGPSTWKLALSEWYSQNSISSERLVRFAQAVGVQTKLEPKQVSCEQNPEWPRLRRESGERTRSPIDEDYMIESLDDLLRLRTIELSRLVWRTMHELDRKYLAARYQKNERNGPQFAASQLVHCLRNAEWVPQVIVSGVCRFCRPAEAANELLPEGFQFDRGYEWLERVHFGKNKRQQSDTDRQRQEAVQEFFGIRDDDSLRMIRQIASWSLEEQRRILEDHERTQQIELPEHAPRNPELRAERIALQAAEAPERITEKRLRSVSIGREAVKQETEPYLRGQYTNQDGEMICQVCQAPLPFKLADGSYYFEMVEFLREPDLQNRHYQNYLALCPNHAAMFQHANGSRNVMNARFQELQGYELAVVLAQKNTTIYFTQTHVLDLRAVIAAEQGKES